MLNLECAGGCGKVIINANIDLTGQDVVGAICPECGASHAGALEFDDSLAGWALLHPAPPSAPVVTVPVVVVATPVPEVIQVAEVPAVVEAAPVESAPAPVVQEAPVVVAPEAPAV